MNSVAPTSPSPLPFVPVAPDDLPAAAGSPAAFAKALDRAAQAQDRPADQQPHRGVRDDAEPDTPSAAQRVARGKRPPRTSAMQSREGAAPQGTRPADEAAPDAQARITDQAPDSPQSDEAALALLDLASLMAGLAQAARAAGETAQTAKATNDSAIDVTTTTGQRATAQRRGNTTNRADAALTAGQDALLAASQGSERRILAAGDVMAAATPLQDSGSSRRAFDNAVGTPLAQAAGATPSALSATTVTEAVPMFQAELAAALGTPEFASALGTQLSVLVRDGVSQAQLHLNPADMGPIEVHIRLDGGNAQVDFSALQAMTRQALEDAVPALASALRESGLTLSGGGVFEQARQPRDEQHGSRTRSAPSAALDAADAVPMDGAVARAFRARGMVDLYA
jgi:flagellar hook-length control protein FliK